MRAGNLFKFAHMSVFVTSIGVGVLGASLVSGSSATAQVLDEVPLDYEEEYEEFPPEEMPPVVITPPMEMPPEEMPPEEMPPEEMPPEEMPPEETPPEEMPPEEMPPEEMPPEEMPPEETPPEEMPPEETPPEEMPPEETPPEEPEEPEEPPMDPRQAIESDRDVDHPDENVVPRKRRLIKSERGTVEVPTGNVATPAATSSITEAIENASDFCDQILDDRYLVDCLGERLQAVARSMPRSGDYAEAREILLDAGKELRALARANKSPTAPVGRAVGTLGNTKVRTRPLTPVRKESVKQVNRAAANVLQEAETKLLRSAAASDRRLIAYAQIAKAVGSNKKLLRSA